MKDLTNVPERFHILFNSDWNKAEESEMSSTNKSQMNELFLEYNRWSIQKAIRSSIEEKEEIIQGFTKD
jgi:hypothetical protein